MGLMGSKSGQSFLPQEYVEGKHERRTSLLCLGLFLIVTFFVVSAFMVTNRAWAKVRTDERAIDHEYKEQSARIEQLKDLDEQKEEMFDKAQVVAMLIEKAPRSVVLADTLMRMPEQMKLTALTLDGERIISKEVKKQAKKPVSRAASRGKSKASQPAEVVEDKPKPPTFTYTIEIEGVAQTNNDIADYLAGLKASPLYRMVELDFIKENESGRAKGNQLQKNWRQFRITMALKPDADAADVVEVASADGK